MYKYLNRTWGSSFVKTSLTGVATVLVTDHDWDNDQTATAPPPLLIPGLLGKIPTRRWPSRH